MITKGEGSHLKTTEDKLLPGEDAVPVGVQSVEGQLHVVSQLPGCHLHVRRGLAHETEV